MKGGTKKMYPLKERKARLWHASLRLWTWKWQTLPVAHRMVFYKQEPSRPPGCIRSGDVFNRHRIFSVPTVVWVQEDISISIPSGFMRCERCRIMGSITTFEEYKCS